MSSYANFLGLKGFVVVPQASNYWSKYVLVSMLISKKTSASKTFYIIITQFSEGKLGVKFKTFSKACANLLRK
jgi:hypothetical protein